MQGGVDVGGLVPSALFPAGNGLTVTGGLIPGHIGYESFHAIDNPNYTRIYGSIGSIARRDRMADSTKATYWWPISAS